MCTARDTQLWPSRLQVPEEATVGAVSSSRLTAARSSLRTVESGLPQRLRPALRLAPPTGHGIAHLSG
eukprot:9127387-Alexandrium_andersonii.AAC.2